MILEIIALACISVLFVVAEPLIRFKYFIYDKIFKKDYQNKWHWKLINCALCSGFWLGLIFTYNIYFAAIISILSELIYKKITSARL